MSRPAAFLDRDGVINLDKGYVHKISDFEWIEGSKEAIKYIKNMGFFVFVISNQSGISKGYYDEKDVEKLHKYINTELLKIDTSIDEFFYSPFHPDIKNDKYKKFKNLRKPNIGMLEMAVKKWPVNINESFLIGDKDTDIKCANNFGIEGFLYKEGSLLNFVKEIIF
tara:strand:- start:1519 stop:2019 length:501 start_codon:yes stop_codon:yes gene_type:complete